MINDEYFVLNDSLHSLMNYAEHSDEGVSSDSFTDPIYRQIWDTMVKMYDNKQKPEADSLKLAVNNEETHHIIDAMMEFHTTRNVAYHRKELLKNNQTVA